MNDNELNVNSLCINTHVTIIQGIISRMSNNCSLCKTLAATVVVALAIISGTNGNPKLLVGAIFSILIFSVSDAVCLSLEVGFRHIFNNFITNLHAGKITTQDIFVISPPQNYLSIDAIVKAFRSWSIFLYYPPLLLLIFIIW